MDYSQPHPSSEGASSSATTNTNNSTTSKQKQIIHTTLQILKATYGPSEGRRLLDGTIVDYSNEESYVPYSRDVLPFLRALMSLEEEDWDDIDKDDGYYYLHEQSCDACVGISGNSTQQQQLDERGFHSTLSNNPQRIPLKRMKHTNKNSFPLMDGRSMNSVFGDPCPGTTKLLRVEYLFRDYFWNVVGDNAEDEMMDCSCVDNEEEPNATLISPNAQHKNTKIRRCHCTTSRVFNSTFAEHERVLLKRQDPLFRLITDSGDDNVGQNSVDMDTSSDSKGMQQHSAPNNSMQADYAVQDMLPLSSLTTPLSSTKSLPIFQQHDAIPNAPKPSPTSRSPPSSPSMQWKLAPTTSEITLPIILPFLAVRQRAMCQLVCSSWRDIVMERGIAIVVDVNDVTLFPRELMNFSSTTGTQRTSPFVPQSPAILPSNPVSSSLLSSSPSHNEPSRALLRGLLTHSYSSLESLVLNDYLPLRPIVDLHPALPFFRKLKRLDISRIPSITDDTLQLISTYIGGKLEVLYMKGLRHVTNDGMVQLVQSCTNLRVLDVSHVHQLDDSAGIAIGQHLTKLEVFHARDNYKWTNESVDLITRNCKSLAQATFWGCIRLTRVSFGNEANGTEALQPLPSILQPPSTKLVLLNLWGCHNLRDASASLLCNLPHLRSLCVSECHKLTDAFVLGISQSLSHLLHIQLRYLRRISDVSIEAISMMPGLYSLDVSFCTKLTVGGLTRLVTNRCASLSELRLYSCRQLNVDGGPIATGGVNRVGGGRPLAQAIRSVSDDSILSFLDLRECNVSESFSRDETFLREMADLGFQESLRGLFVRPAVWTERVRIQLVSTLSQDDIPDY
eukprot:g7913.t1 g7913   contig26:552629-555163(+)